MITPKIKKIIYRASAALAEADKELCDQDIPLSDKDRVTVSEALGSLFILLDRNGGYHPEEAKER